MDKYLPITPLYGRPEFAQSLPKGSIPEESLPPDSAYRYVTDELQLDGRAGLNLATFCNEAYADPWCTQLLTDNLKINFIDHEEFPATNLAEKRAIRMLAHEVGTFIAEGDEDPDTATGMYGAATIGSSEAIMLGLIAHKYGWTEHNRELLRQGKADAQDRPVVLMSAHVHGCWDKFCRYYGAAALYVEIDGPPYSVSGAQVQEILDTAIEHPTSPYAKEIREKLGYLERQPGRTIGELVMCVGAVVGSTFTGNSDDVRAIDDAVDDYCASSNLGLDIPIHVDLASAGFVLLFSENGKEIPFDFRSTKRVRSLNMSNHKFGMTYPGMGSVVFRDAKVVDPSLVYDITYLGGSFTDYTVNFSRGSAMVLMQYYNFLRFGRAGYQAIMGNCLHNTRHFVAGLEAHHRLGSLLRVISDPEHLPVCVLTWQHGVKHEGWDLRDLSDLLRERGWIVPAYVLPNHGPEEILDPSDGTQVLRIVVQMAITSDKLDTLLRDMDLAVQTLRRSPRVQAATDRPASTGYRCG